MPIPANPFEGGDPVEVAKLEGAYTTCRADVIRSADPVAHGVLRGGAARSWYETVVKVTGINAPYVVLAQAYAGALVEVARMRNERDGVTVDPLPEWPATDDPREHARLRVAAFFDGLMRLCVDHQILPHVGGSVANPWLQDLSTNARLASGFHWCETASSFAAHEPVDMPGYQAEDVKPWQVPDHHE